VGRIRNEAGKGLIFIGSNKELVKISLVIKAIDTDTRGSREERKSHTGTIPTFSAMMTHEQKVLTILLKIKKYYSKLIRKYQQ